MTFGISTVVLDVETTGLGHHARPPRDDAVVQIALACRRKNGGVHSWSSYCNPGNRYFEDGRAENALQVNGISLDTIRDAPTAMETAVLFKKQLKKVCVSPSSVLFTSFNKRFDQPFLAREPWNLSCEQWGECVMLGAQRHLKYYKWPKLAEAAHALKIVLPEGSAHDAAFDAHVALLIHEKIVGGCAQRS